MQRTFFRTLVLSICLMAVPLAATAALPLSTEIGTNAQGLPSLAPVVKQVNPAVVNISTTGTVQMQRHPFFNDPFFRRFFGAPEQAPEREVHSLGSGVVVDAEQGYILTNHHVIGDADEIEVTLMDGREYKAKVVGSDPKTDVAVLQIEAPNLTEIPLANSDKLAVGDFVLAIGNPFGFGHSVTSGIVSALGRSGLMQGNYEYFIQTDASINPGNSGGALVNLRGQLVGINTAIVSRSGGNIGIGFAIPINMARGVMQQILEYGEVQRGVLGVYIQALTPELADAMDTETNEGALITRIIEGSAADAAGIKAGDVVTALNGEAILGSADLRNQIGLLRVGEEIELTVLRDGERIEIEATIRAPDEFVASAENLHKELAGAKITQLTEQSAMFGEVEGVLVSDVKRGSEAAENGLRPGDVITSVNRQPTPTLEAFRNAVEDSNTLLLNVRRGPGALFIVIRPD
ncbi:MAG TPA: DegQ family serine endoprotease [Gammaproteobacteria bacterium]|nr:DegQ family serine endoprotease [Gammaproteobacteria bacterium]